MSKEKILIVEDNEDERELIKIFLRKRNFETRSAKSISTTMRQLKKNEFDIILLDLNLPDGSGLDILEKINLDYKNRIIIITGVDDIKIAVEAMKNGAFDFKTKPLDFPGLISTINKAIDMHIEYENFKNGLRSIPLEEKIIEEIGRLRISLKDFEKIYIEQLLKKTKYCMNETSKILGINRSTLYRKMKEYEIQSLR
jgi:DNA-binding NtrC family response regulator